jgi:hypothetical protein
MDGPADGDDPLTAKDTHSIFFSLLLFVWWPINRKAKLALEPRSQVIHGIANGTDRHARTISIYQPWLLLPAAANLIKSQE